MEEKIKDNRTMGKCEGKERKRKQKDEQKKKKH
jgi:hypothetical protein